MGKLSLVGSQTISLDFELSPRLKRQLLNELKAIADLKVEAADIALAIAGHTATVRELRESTGEKSISLEGFTSTNVTGETSTLDKKMLMLRCGVTVAELKECTTTKPKKAYELVTCPK